ncbi:MAG: ribonuclease P Rpr2/Rpp21/SNM1 subunit, partial [Candidatus Micrarchaeaceae archaeon]
MYKSRQIIDSIAAERIDRLFELAEKRTLMNDAGSKSLAKRYVKLLRLISAHYRISIPKRIKERICKSCNSVMIPGLNCTVRL